MDAVLEALETGVQTIMAPLGFEPEQSLHAFLGFHGLLYIEYVVSAR
jgi:hypothetical protein